MDIKHKNMRKMTQHFKNKFLKQNMHGMNSHVKKEGLHQFETNTETDLENMHILKKGCDQTGKETKQE
jgi:hypothetical protein